MQLLVSPSTIDEAIHSVAADIIDVKKPSEGSLGANFPWVIREIKTLLAKPLSAAIGDFDYKPGGAALAAYGAACAGADFVKTSTGYSKGGATASDIALMRYVVGYEMGVKASGGIRTFEDAQRMIESGANRIGASASVQIVKGIKTDKIGY